MDLPGDARYVHGPVVVSDCFFCHHYHNSIYAGVLIAESTDLCLRCHNGADLTKGAHHEALDQSACTECHDPHVGDNRFFVKQDEP